MALSKLKLAYVGMVLALGGCSFASDALFPSMTGGDPRGDGSSSAVASPAYAGSGGSEAYPALGAINPPVMGTSSFEPLSVTPGTSTGTFVGKKVVDLRGELQQLQGHLGNLNSRLQQLRAETIQDSQLYHGTVAAISARLQVGTTPGNPHLMKQWNEAQITLEKVSDDVARMNQLAAESAPTSNMAAYLLDSVRASRTLSGAVDEDHRQLSILEDETNRTVVLVERLISEVSNDIQRQQQYVATERSNLNILAIGVKNGQLYGASLANRTSYPPASPVASGMIASGGLQPMADVSGRPLMVIKFDRPNPTYDQALYAAASKALERKPNAVFELVAVSPGATGPGPAALNSMAASKNAEQVLRTLTSMGLPANRIRLSASAGGTASSLNEVHVYVK